MLLSFLITLAILVPVFLLYFLIGLAFERFKAFSSLPLYLCLYLFGQFAIYWARRYRLTRTIGRGIRLAAALPEMIRSDVQETVNRRSIAGPRREPDRQQAGGASRSPRAPGILSRAAGLTFYGSRGGWQTQLAASAGLPFPV